MKKLKILVTGNLGFIGSHLMPELKKKHHVIGWDKSDGDNIFDNDIEPVIKACDVVIHLAAQVSVGKSFKNPEETFRTNVLGTAKILELCMKHNTKLIYPSSAAVYHRELSPYAESKAMAEDLIIKSGYKKTVVLRFFNVYGKSMNADSGSIMYRFLTDEKLVIYGDGEQTRDYINVNDIVNIIVESINNKWNGQVVDCGTGQAHTANYVAGLFAYFRGKKLNYEAPKKEIKWSLADTKILKLLYKKPLVTDLGSDIQTLCRKRPL